LISGGHVNILNKILNKKLTKKILVIPTVVGFFSGLLILFGLYTGGCSYFQTKPQIPIRPSSEVSIMSYNVENLFDAEHDEGKDDETFLPLALKQSGAIKEKCDSLKNKSWQKDCLETDWTEELLNTKLKHISDAILQVDSQGPDILIVLEVENIKILKRLSEEYLKQASYQTVVLIEGPDKRGIDVGLLSRLPLAGEAQLHTLDLKSEDKEPIESRGILNVPLKLPNGETLTILGVHFPSQFNKTPVREQAIAQLNEIVKGLYKSKGDRSLVVAGGDFNISAKEETENQLFSKNIGETWKVSHLIGCRDCLGSHFYKGEWAFLDALLFSPHLVNEKNEALQGKWQLDNSSITTPREGKFQVNFDGTPLRFSPRKPLGCSDHLPILGRLRLNP
jgi:hypothetical protein